MSKAEWEGIYWDAWKIYYTPEHIETILKRARAKGINIKRLMLIILWFSASLAVEKVHPLQGGVLRLKSRHERRPELPRQSVMTFYPMLAWEFLSKQARLLAYGWRLYRMCNRVAAAKDGMSLYGHRADAGVGRRARDAGNILAEQGGARCGGAYAQDQGPDGRRELGQDLSVVTRRGTCRTIPTPACLSKRSARRARSQACRPRLPASSASRQTGADRPAHQDHQRRGLQAAFGKSSAAQPLLVERRGFLPERRQQGGHRARGRRRQARPSRCVDRQRQSQDRIARACPRRRSALAC